MDDMYPGAGLNAGIAIHSPRFSMQARSVRARIAIYAVINEERCLSNVLSQRKEGIKEYRRRQMKSLWERYL